MKQYKTLLLIFVILFIACEKKKDDTKDEEIATVAAESSAKEDDEEEKITKVTLDTSAKSISTNIALVESEMLPKSLDSDMLNLTSSGPCEGTAGFFDCQPNLLKIYVGMAKMLVANINEIISTLGVGILKQVEIPTDGKEICDQIVIAGGDEISKIEYCVTSATKYKVMMHTAKGPFIFLSVADQIYQLKAAMENQVESEESSDGGPGNIDATVVYTSTDAFSIDIKASGSKCQADDIRAPQNFAIKISKEDGVWQGKSMLYHPLWQYSDSDGITCTTPSSDALALAFYTDFVGNDEGATASIYFMPRTITDMTQIASYEVSDFCTNYPNSCQNGRSFGDPNPIATFYQNPFCVQETVSTTWGQACVSTNTKIATPEYGAASLWLAPSELKDLSVTFPTSLAN